MKPFATLLVVLSIAAGLLWDLAVIAEGRGTSATWCDAFRSLNAGSGGLLGLCYIALGVHLLCYQWFPAAWGGQ
jgi:hypothetical protein